ncbi:MAG: polymerase III, delta prime subunit protein [Candidatus Magasanikbacteria bacterium GW2011_GWD2_43_18]|uniref:Polymerase III, delta prime subunit protein n=1 Tax=Candidatus Magasanikbacteria bacterium GW2011_GWE2_42_7 TaxID=1619052 RepID=A0A0G1BCD9_9BACT|nr:MAG: polymerase III, delta prime subunit protein [Candidatus Magasanikbacteria bacterium GW2011_GWC2_42_27]KKS71035.1 MAG: polymerase III, delta prime subunit protein [Candidatus Magasanikbacteria bacterium GW2011_GWE2_42_7]KKT03820.1 MAG: polymerase III, delta prime subunit protein [Candidatus Magasanikbacteria bacterium GW2011_GWD2_43_18]KKT25646.1 MAG: polymerase III, delta prime subunit protein [Candidatus Magasanikbacteria bacterium GW2011_GWA2_43_9]HBB38467.1 hypothetical protein [Cand
MNIIGHKDILTFFDSARAAGHLHHAYLFVGRPQLGKRTVAEHVTQLLFDSQKPLHTNPDFFFLKRGIHEKTGKTKKYISIEDVQGLQQFLRGKPFLHKKKVAIIDDAHLLSSGAMNALLKTLEEPRGDATIFLVAEDESALLETIRSRCQTCYFYPVRASDIESHLLEQKIDPPLAAKMATGSGGYPGKAIIWADNPEQYEWYTKELARCEGLFGKPLYEQLAAVEDLFAKKDDHIAARSELLTILDIWLALVRTQYTDPASPYVGKYDIVRTYSAIQRAKKDLLANVHPRMLIEQVLLTF